MKNQGSGEKLCSMLDNLKEWVHETGEIAERLDNALHKAACQGTDLSQKDTEELLHLIRLSYFQFGTYEPSQISGYFEKLNTCLSEIYEQ